MEVYKMLGNVFIDNAKVMAKGQITIPKDVREVLGVSNGDRVSFIVENGLLILRFTQCKCCKMKCVERLKRLVWIQMRILWQWLKKCAKRMSRNESFN